MAAWAVGADLGGLPQRSHLSARDPQAVELGVDDGDHVVLGQPAPVDLGGGLPPGTVGRGSSDRLGVGDRRQSRAEHGHAFRRRLLHGDAEVGLQAVTEAGRHALRLTGPRPRRQPEPTALDIVPRSRPD